MVILIDDNVNVLSMTHFRWHDVGDIQGVWHLRNIIAVCVWVVPELMQDAEIFSDEKFFQTAYLTDNCLAEISKNSTGTYLQGIICNGDVDKREFSMA